jgi:hypothetical protein
LLQVLLWRWKFFCVLMLTPLRASTIAVFIVRQKTWSGRALSPTWKTTFPWCFNEAILKERVSVEETGHLDIWWTSWFTVLSHGDPMTSVCPAWAAVRKCLRWGSLRNRCAPHGSGGWAPIIKEHTVSITEAETNLFLLTIFLWYKPSCSQRARTIIGTAESEKP